MMKHKGWLLAYGIFMAFVVSITFIDRVGVLIAGSPTTIGRLELATLWGFTGTYVLFTVYFVKKGSSKLD